MIGRLKTTLGLGLLALFIATTGCTAFAEAVDGGAKDGADGGTFDGGVGLIIEPVEFIRQGQKANYTIQFAVPPPWMDEVTDLQDCGLTKFRFVKLDDPTEQLYDLSPITDYCEDGECEIDTIGALVQAHNDADTMVNRLLIFEVAFEQDGKPQQLWHGSGRFWVFPDNDAQDLDGGTDGDDGSADGGDDP